MENDHFIMEDKNLTSSIDFIILYNKRVQVLEM